MSDIQMVTIKKNVFPDVQVVISRKKYNDEIEYYLVSFVKSESVIIAEECTEDGIFKKSYKDPEFYACRMNDDMIEICDTKMGWIPAYPELNDEYKSILADKELLSE